VNLADGSPLTDPATWVNFGVLGLVFLAMISGFIWTKPSVQKILEERDRVVKEREKAEEQRDAMAQVLQEKLLPVIGDFISTTRTLIPILQQLQALQTMTPVLQELVRAEETGDRAKRRRPKG
jgi:hypothetical protein